MAFLVQLGAIVLAFCVLVAVLENVNGGRKRERAIRTQMLIDEWIREHPDG